MCALKRPASPHVALVVVQHQGRLHVVGQRFHLQLAEEATGLPAIGCCFLFLSAATRHTDAWQRARVQAGSSTQSSDYRDAGSSTSSCESVPSSSCVLLAAESQLVGFGAAIGRRYDAAARHQCGLLHAAPHGLLASRIGLGHGSRLWPTEPQSGANGFAPEGVKSGQISAQGPLF